MLPSDHISEPCVLSVCCVANKSYNLIVCNIILQFPVCFYHLGVLRGQLVRMCFTLGSFISFLLPFSLVFLVLVDLSHSCCSAISSMLLGL